MTITKFERSMLDQLRTDINSALESVSKKYGIALHAGNCKFAPYEANFKVEAKIKSPAAASNLKMLLSMFGIDTTEFNFRGDQYKITGINPRKRKAPILASRESNGKTYCFPKELIIGALATGAQA